MPTESYDIVGSFNEQRVLSLDPERSINLFEYHDPQGKKEKSLLSTSGLINANYNFLGTSGGVRAQFFYQNDMYVVIGSNVIRIDTAGNVAILGSFTFTNTGYVGIDANTFQVIFVDGVQGWIWDNTALTFKLITDTSFPSDPIDVCALDGFFVCINGGTNNFQLSSFNQGMVWGASSNTVTTSHIALPNELIIGPSTIGGPTTTANYATGVPVQLTLGTLGSLSGTGLAVATTYYSIFVDATHIKLATTYQNAILGIAIIITGDITPTVNLVSNGQLQQASVTTHPGTLVACKNSLHREDYSSSANSSLKYGKIQAWELICRSEEIILY